MAEKGGMSGGALATGALEQRWPTAFAFGVACLIGAGVAFWRTPPLYRSVALMAVRAPGDGGDPVALAEVEAPAVASRQTIELAAASPNWPGGRPLTPRAGDELERRLSAEVRPGGVVAVSFTDLNPEIARARLDACVRAYAEIRAERDREHSARRIRVLDDERRSLEVEINAVSKEMLDQAKVYGTLELKAVLDRRLESALGLERTINELDMQDLLARAKAGAAAPPKNPAVAALSARLANERASLADLERQRLRMADLADRRGRLAQRVAEVQRQRDALSAQRAAGAGVMLLLPTAGPAFLAVDHRARNAVIGGLLGAISWFALRWLWRASRVWWRVASARRAFPLEAPPPQEPRPVVPIDA